MPAALVAATMSARRPGGRMVDEVVEHGVLAAIHRRGGSDHDQPDEQVARDLLEPVDPAQPEEAEHHLQEHGRRHDREDQAADMAEPVIGVPPEARAPPLPSSRRVRARVSGSGMRHGAI